MCHRARTSAVRNPSIQVDEHRANQLSALERSVSTGVGLVDNQLDDACQTGVADEGINDKAAVIGGLDVWRRRWVERATVDGRVVERYRLQLSGYQLWVTPYRGSALTKLYL